MTVVFHVDGVLSQFEGYEQLPEFDFSVHYRGHRVELVFSEHRVEVTSRPGPAAPITVLLRQQTVELHPGAHHTFSLDSGRDAHNRDAHR